MNQLKINLTGYKPQIFDIKWQSENHLKIGKQLIQSVDNF